MLVTEVLLRTHLKNDTSPQQERDRRKRKIEESNNFRSNLTENGN